mgnify:FL=1|tara:strand:- start:227 stop:571 length:345 start_codon:yes stop_codon:yes gene_type:complete
MSDIKERQKKRAKAIIISRQLLKYKEYDDEDTKITAYHDNSEEIGKHSNGESIWQCKDCEVISDTDGWDDPCSVLVEHVPCKAVLKSGKNKGEKCGKWASPEFGLCGHHWRNMK